MTASQTSDSLQRPVREGHAALTSWRFRHFRKKHLAVLARLLACRIEDLMDTSDEGVPVGSAYGQNLANRLRFLYHWTQDRIEGTLSHLRGEP
jgi:hypothetical protein